MKTLKIITCLLTSILIVYTASAQLNFCTDNTKKLDKTFKISPKSDVIKLKKGQTHKLKVFLSEDQIYYFSVKGDKSLGDVQFRIIEGKDNGKTLYDNSAYEFASTNTLTTESELLIVLEITTQPDSFKRKDSKYSEVELLIAYKEIIHHENNNYNNIITYNAGK